MEAKAKKSIRTIKRASIPRTKIILETRYSKKDFAGPIDPKHPVKLRITYEYVQKYYTLPDPDDPGKKLSIDLTKEDFARTMGQKARNDFKDQQKTLNKIEERAARIIETLKPFSFH